jgi:hypothetical protein
MPYSENKIHQQNIIVAEFQKQVAYSAAAGNAASIKAADLAYFRSLRSSAIANNCSPAQFQAALRELGTTGS